MNQLHKWQGTYCQGVSCKITFRVCFLGTLLASGKRIWDSKSSVAAKTILCHLDLPFRTKELILPFAERYLLAVPRGIPSEDVTFLEKQKDILPRIFGSCHKQPSHNDCSMGRDKGPDPLIQLIAALSVYLLWTAYGIQLLHYYSLIYSFSQCSGIFLQHISASPGSRLKTYSKFIGKYSEEI